MRQHARNASLVLFASLAAYLLSLPLSARLALLFAKSVNAPVARALLGVVALDLAKLPTLLLAAWLFGRAITLGPTTAAAAIVLTTYAFEVCVTLLLGQTGWLGHAPVLLARGAALFALVFCVGLVTRKVAPKPAKEPTDDASTRDDSAPSGEDEAPES